MSGTQHDDILTFDIEDHSIIANAKTVGAKFRVNQALGMLEGVVLKTQKSSAHALFNGGIKSADVFYGFPGINQLIAQ